MHPSVVEANVMVEKDESQVDSEVASVVASVENSVDISVVSMASVVETSIMGVVVGTMGAVVVSGPKVGTTQPHDGGMVGF